MNAAIMPRLASLHPSVLPPSLHPSKLDIHPEMTYTLPLSAARSFRVKEIRLMTPGPTQVPPAVLGALVDDADLLMALGAFEQAFAAVQDDSVLGTALTAAQRSLASKH